MKWFTLKSSESFCLGTSFSTDPSIHRTSPSSTPNCQGIKAPDPGSLAINPDDANTPGTAQLATTALQIKTFGDVK